MPVELICRDCGQAFTPTRDEIAKGPESYRSCPDCRARRVTEGERAASELLERCRDRGIALRVEAGRIRWAASPGAMTVELVRAVKACEPALVAAISTTAGAMTP